MVLVEMAVMNPDLKYKVVIHNDDWDQAEIWCEQNFGVFGQSWYKLGIDPVDQIFNTDRETESIWYFRYEKDAMIFSLKWS